MPVRQVVVLCGGLGTRLGPLTRSIPKSMMPVGDRPFLEHLLRQMAARGFREALLLTGHLADPIEKHFGEGDSVGLSIRYSREPAPLGTGGALRWAQRQLDEVFLMVNGDTWLPLDHHRLVEAWTQRQPHALMTVATGEGLDAARNLRVESDGRIRTYEKGRPPADANAVDAGVYILRRAILELLPPTGPSSLEAQVWPELARRGDLWAYWTRERFYDIGTPDRLETIRKHFEATLA